MGFRFRKSLRAGGARINIGKRGVTSVSFGKPGRSVNISKRGVRQTFRIPRTGLSYQTKGGCCLLPAILVVFAGLVAALLAVRGRGWPARR